MSVASRDFAAPGFQKHREASHANPANAYKMNSSASHFSYIIPLSLASPHALHLPLAEDDPPCDFLDRIYKINRIYGISTVTLKKWWRELVGYCLFAFGFANIVCNGARVEYLFQPFLPLSLSVRLRLVPTSGSFRPLTLVVLLFHGLLLLSLFI